MAGAQPPTEESQTKLRRTPVDWEARQARRSRHLPGSELTSCSIHWFGAFAISASRCLLRFLNRRAYLALPTFPMLPRSFFRGKTARKPKRMTESARRPDPVKSASVRETTSSNSGTA